MERLTFGLSTTVIGMLVVFSGLVILIACIYVMTSITGRKKKAPAAQPVPAPAAPVEEAAPSAEEAAADDGLIAAITAAVAMMLEGEGKNSGFVVRRIRRSPAPLARARAAREEQIYSRL